MGRETVFIGFGSNVGDRVDFCDRAVTLLTLLPHSQVIGVSMLYETEPVEFTKQPWFLNCAVSLDTEKTPGQLLRALLEIERTMGRLRTQQKGPRKIDIDILLFGDSSVNTATLTIPHPAMHERRFVLEPLAEIAPDARHPLLNKTARELRDSLPPGQAVRRVSGK